MVHELADYANLQTMKIGGFLKQQPITVLIDTGSTNNFMNIVNSPGVCWELAEVIGGLLGVRWKLAEGIGSLPGVRKELAEGDRELARMASGNSPEEDRETHRKIVEGSKRASRDRDWKSGGNHFFEIFDGCTAGE
ncbi:hypothetical protein BHM03_00049106 [Ensete ventricosum]|nr:hypothetical protein BHM03_00049106 [Ensete ventricosum]